VGVKTSEDFRDFISELVASRISTELKLEARFMLISLGVDLDEPTLMLRDDMSEI
jgi:hypothetical protein